MISISISIILMICVQIIFLSFRFVEKHINQISFSFQLNTLSRLEDIYEYISPTPKLRNIFPRVSVSVLFLYVLQIRSYAVLKFVQNIQYLAQTNDFYIKLMLMTPTIYLSYSFLPYISMTMIKLASNIREFKIFHISGKLRLEL